MSKIPECRLETYWANKEVFTCPEFQNVIWKPTGLTKRFFYMSKIPKCRLETYWANKEIIFVYGPMAPGAHIFLINVFIYFLIYICINILPIELPIHYLID